METARILVVDDEPSILRLLQEALTQWGYQVKCAASGTEAVEAVRAEMFDAVITDIRMPEMSGLELLKEIKRHDESIEVVMMTGYPTIASAVEALKEGAYDYLSKPVLLDELRHLMTRMTERRFLRGEVNTLRERLGEELAVTELVGNSVPMQRVKEIIAKVAVTDSPVLIEGESGTGKELVAAAIHRLSPRGKGPFLPVNCSAIPEDLLESEFFGHVRGAFSGAIADTLGLFRGANDGTIFLDEIAELSPGLQVKLLRVLQEMQVRPVGSTKAYSVDVRVIAATNRDLDRAIAEGKFRQDLYYRLNVVRITLPSLRARPDDVAPLVNHFLRRFNRRFRREIRGITPDALSALQGYDFPGNVRELENLIERAFAMGAREQITLADLPSLTSGHATPVATSSGGAIPQLAEVEKELILRALAHYSDDKEAAARALGISRRTIYRRLKEYGML
jgi:DNA-binding NtrC family response regulator